MTSTGRDPGQPRRGSGRSPAKRATARHVIPGRRPVAEALLAQRPLREVVIARNGGPELDELAATARAAGVTVHAMDAAELDVLSEGVLHQGVVAVAPPFSYRSLDELDDADLVVVLDGVTDPHNLGAIARTAEAAGAGALVVRERRAAPVTPAAEKASAGALSWLPVVAVPNLVRVLAALAERGFWSAGLAGDAGDDVWASPLLDGKVALVVGAEGAGLSRLVSERVDGLVRIPMEGSVGSLNASVAAAVALYEVRRRRHAQSP